MSSEPTILLRYSETLYVAFAVVIQELERRTSYPTDNLHLVLSAYIKGRDEWLKSQGWTDDQRMEITAAATEALTKFIDERSLKDAEPDFDAWTEELNNDVDS